MAEQIILKTCRVCKETKSIFEFHKHPKMHDGHRNICKLCRCKQQKQYQEKYKQLESNKVAQRKYWQSKKGKVARKHYAHSEKGKLSQRKSHKRFHAHNPNHRKAMHVVNNAIRTGKLPHPNTLQCHYCPAQAKQYHHHKGYAPEHWLDVVPVCIKCHSKIHNESVLIACSKS